MLNKNPTKIETNRISHLDGLRGFAILNVFLFHAYSSWPINVPYGDQFKPYFSFGFLGVQLFFLISGFVILLTLEKCSGFGEFVKRRWLRLFPAMLVCSLFLISTIDFFPDRVGVLPNAYSIIPGILFIEPVWLDKLFGTNFIVLEGAFWSLYTEFKFYVFGGLVFFMFGRVWLIAATFLVSLAANSFKVLDSLLDKNNEAVHFIAEALRTLSFDHFGWFACGAACYLYWRLQSVRWLAIAVALLLFSAVFTRPLQEYSFPGALVTGVIFIGTLKFDRLGWIFKARFFQFLGFVSYPLYLVHENITISSAVGLHRQFENIPPALWPLLSLCWLCLFSYLVAKYVEPFIRHILRFRIAKISLGGMPRP